MKTQTVCTLALCGLLIIEILPVPFSSLYSLYAVRKRPDWLPKVIDSLYIDKPTDKEVVSITQATYGEYDSNNARRKYTMTLAVLFVIDLLVPVVIPTAFYIVRRRPTWFKVAVAKLYEDKLASPMVYPAKTQAPERIYENPRRAEELEKKLAKLESKNREVARSLLLRSKRVTVQ